MNYEDDELERMRARREQRRNSAAKEKETPSGRTAENEQKASRGSSHKKGSHKKGSRKTASKKKKSKVLIAEILVLVVLVIAAIGCYAYQKTFGSLQKVEFNEDEVINLDLSDQQLEVMKGYWNVACFGVDSRLVNGKANVGKGTNADVNLIASINMETGEIKLVSAFRDTYLNINDKDSYNKLNYAYAQGGPEQAVKALNKNLGLNITQYATFNWKAVADAINILGGVDITLSESEFSWINAYITETVNETGIGSHQLTHAGDVHLDGVQAVAYGRLRLGDTDYARTERQRIILKQAFEKAKSADWNTLNCIIETIMPQLATNISLTDLIPLARNITKYYMGDTAGFPSARGEMSVGKIGDCVIPQTLEFNVKELHKFLFGEEDYEVPSNVKAYSDHIASVTGLTTEGKVIGHVAVDKGVSANSYIKRQQQKVSAQAAETAKASVKDETEESLKPEDEPETDENGDLIEEPETDENGDPIEEPFDPEEDFLNGEWDEDWYDDQWNGADDSNGPGSNVSGPGNGTSSGSSTKPGSTDKTSAAEEEEDTGVGPGASSGSGDDSESGNVITRPGSITDPSGSTVKPGGSTTSGSSTTAPGSSKTSGSSTTAPGSSTTSGSSTTAPGSSKTSGSSTTAPGSSKTSDSSTTAPGGSTTSGSSTVTPGGSTTAAESSSSGPGA